MQASDAPPRALRLSALLAFAAAALDVVDTASGAMLGASGNVMGTLLRDALLVLGGVLMLRRSRWGLWLTILLGALSFFRFLSADQWIEILGIVCAAAAMALAFHPECYRWVSREDAPAPAPA